jgi:hypothetical protein
MFLKSVHEKRFINVINYAAMEPDPELYPILILSASAT